MPEEEETEEGIDLSSISLDRRAQTDRRGDERRHEARRSDEDRRNDDREIDFGERRQGERREAERRQDDRRVDFRREAADLEELPEIDWESEQLPVESKSLRGSFRLIILLLAVAAVIALVLY